MIFYILGVQLSQSSVGLYVTLYYKYVFNQG